MNAKCTLSSLVLFLVSAGNVLAEEPGAGTRAQVRSGLAEAIRSGDLVSTRR